MENNSKFSLKTIRDNLSVIILFPTLLGGIWQIIQLLRIKPVMVRFFSITQLVSDGLLIFVALITILTIPFLVVYSFKLVGAEMYPTTISVKKKRLYGLLFMIILGSFLYTSYDLCNYDYNVVDFRFFINTFSFPSTFQTLLFLLLSGIFPTFFKNHSSGLNFFAVIIFIANILFYGILFDKVTQKNLSTLSIEFIYKKYECKNKSKIKPKLLYFNDKYIFLELSCDQKSKEIYIEKFDNFFTN